MESFYKNARKQLKAYKNWRKSTQLVALLFILISIPLTVLLLKNFVLFLSRAASANLYFVPSQANLPPDQTLSLHVDSGSNEVPFARVEISFDNTKVQLSGEVQTTNLLPVVIGKTSASQANSTGKIIFALTACDTITVPCDPKPTYPSGDFEIAKLPFKTVTGQATTAQITVLTDTSELVDQNNNAYGLNAQNATLNLNSQQPTSTPKPPTSTPFQAPTNTPTRVPTPTVSGPTPTLTQGNLLSPIADAFVNSNTASVNYGSDSTLQVDASPDVKVSYLRFDLSSLAGQTIQSAKLRLRVLDDPASGSFSKQNIKIVNDTGWGENTITWNNKPSTGGTLATISNATGGSFIEKDVTYAVTQRRGGAISFAIDQTGTDGLDMYSKEYSVTEYHPYLVVDTGQILPTSTPIPSSTPRPTNTPFNLPTPTPSGNADTTLYINPATTTVASGRQFQLDVNIDTGNNSVVGVEMYLSFDPTYLQVNDINPGSFFNNPVETVKNIDNGAGKIDYTIHIPPSDPAQNGNGQLAIITFTAKTVLGTTTLNIDPTTIVGAINIGDVNGLKSSSNGTINIIQATLPGDINVYNNGICGDGVVNILDYVTLFEHFGEAPTNDPCADINADGKVNILDYVILFENFGRTL